MRHRPTAALGTILLACCPAAQTTWVVAPTTGAGVHFTSIQAAIDAAAHGDTVIVRAGSYNEAPSIGKGITLVGDAGATITSLSPINLDVAGVPAGTSLTVRGLGFGQISRIAIRECRGQVHLEQIAQPVTTVSNAFSITDCAQVTLTRLSAIGFPAVTVADSHVVLTDCTVAAAGFLTTSVAMLVDGGETTVVDGTYRGGSSALAPGSPAIELRQGGLVLAGSSTLVQAGDDPTGGAVSAIGTLGGNVSVDPAVMLRTTSGAPGIAGAASVVVQPVPSVVADDLPSGGDWQLTLHAPAGSAFCLFASLPQPRLTSPWGEVWFSPATHLVIACGLVGPGDVFAASVPVPPLPRGLALVAQAGVATSGAIVTSVPVVTATP